LERKGKEKIKILTIMGSPKKNGKTAFALEKFEGRMKDAGHSVERINAVDVKINCCIECYACTRKKGEHGCPQKDSWNFVCQKMFAADAIIYATPLFCFDMTAQMKLLPDRHFSLMGKSLLRGKQTAMLITCGGKEENNADLLQTFFKRAFDGKQSTKFSTNLVGTYVVPESVTSGFEGRAKGCRKNGRRF
jgi:multimeric flavodoxin WrbA